MPTTSDFTGLLTTAEYRTWQAGQMSEATLQTHVLALANTFGWLGYHTHDSRRSRPGFPDLVLVSAEQGRVLYRELKSAKGRTTREQDRWLEELAGAGQDTAVWRPIDLLDGTVERALRPTGRG